MIMKHYTNLNQIGELESSKIMKSKQRSENINSNLATMASKTSENNK
jgi:hypothetical protein